MILELADIRIHPGQQAAFDEAIQRGLTAAISGAKGFQGFKVHKGIENPERYILQIFWETLGTLCLTRAARESCGIFCWEYVYQYWLAGNSTVNPSSAVVR